MTGGTASPDRGGTGVSIERTGQSRSLQAGAFGVRAVIVAAIVATVLFGGSTTASAATLQPGEKFPDWSEFELTGPVPDDSSAQITIVDFWASWCAPCKASFPAFNELQREFASAGVVIVAVSVDQNERALRAFLTRFDPEFVVLHDVNQELVARVRVPSMPTSFVLDAEGVIRFVHVGFHGASSIEQYREQIRTLLSASS